MIWGAGVLMLGVLDGILMNWSCSSHRERSPREEAGKVFSKEPDSRCQSSKEEGLGQVEGAPASTTTSPSWIQTSRRETIWT